MDFFSWLQIVIICSLGAMSPGPSLAIVLRNTIKGGKKQGVLTGIGHGLGICIYAGLVVTGLTIALVSSPNLEALINYAGAILLVWLGLSFIGVKFIPAFGILSSEKLEEKKNLHHEGFISGFLIALLNPKIAAFFLAIFSPFLSAKAHLFEKVILIFTAGGIDALWYIFVVLVLSRSVFSRILETHSAKIEQTIGGFLLFLAVGLILRTW